MATTQYRVEAVLAARDAGMSNALGKATKAANDLKMGVDEASKGTSSFKDTMLGMASAIGITTLISKGFDMIKSSVGSAMARADTMDNFNRTISMLSGNTKTAERALSDLNTMARGTAYGLDVAAVATQGLYTSGIEIDNSTRYIGGWMDAVATYGNNTNAQLSSVTYQLSQMVAKGKANMGDLKSAMEAGIPVIRMYAEATGQTTEEVNSQMAKGQITAEQFLSAIDRAFREGTKSFKSIEGAAKNAGGTWSGTFDNMRAATARGMLSIINSIEEGRKKANMPGMKDSVANFGRTTEKILNNVAKVTGFVAEHFDKLTFVLKTGLVTWGSYKIVDEVTTRFKNLSNSFELAKASSTVFFNEQAKGTSISKMFSGALQDVEGRKRLLAAAQKLNIEMTEKDNNGITRYIMLTEAQKAAILAETGALSFKSLVVGVLTGKIGLVTAAQILWNTAMAANPIGMVVAGVALLGAGLKKLNDWLNRTSAEHKKANEEAKDLASTNNQLVSATKDLSKSFKDNTGDARLNANESRRLVGELKNLSAQTMDTERKQYLMGKVVDELNSKYPELGVQLDETGTALKGSTDEIYRQIDAMETMARESAMKEHLSDLYKQQFELQMSITDTTEKMAEMEEQGTDMQAKFLGFGEKMSDGYRDLNESQIELQQELDNVNSLLETTQEELGILTQAQYEQMEAEEAQRRSLENLSEQYGLTTDQILQYVERTGEGLEDAGQQVVELSEKYGLSTDNIIAYTESMGISLEDFAKTHEEELKTAEKAVESYVEITTSGFNRLEQSTAISMDEYMDNLRENIRATNEWSQNVNTLMRAGVSEGIIKELEKLGPAGALQAQQFVKELEELNGGALGEYEDLNQAAKDKLAEFETISQEGIEAAYEASKTSMDAKDYIALGEQASKEMAKGLVNQKKNLNRTAEESGQTIKKSIKTGAGDMYSEGKSLGSSTGYGLRDGINATSGSIYATARSIAGGVSSTLRQALRIHSPSRVTRKLGEYTGDGFVLGLEDTLPDISKVTRNMAQTVSDIDNGFNGVRSSVNFSSDGLNMNQTPAVITLILGGREYSAFVEDVTDQQDKKVRLKMAYEGG